MKYRPPGYRESRYLSKFKFDKTLFYSQNDSNIELYLKLEDFFNSTISVSLSLRWKTLEPIIKSMEELVLLSQNRTLIDLGTIML